MIGGVFKQRGEYVFSLYDFELKPGMVKSFKQTSYLWGLLGSEMIIEFYDKEVKEGKHGRNNKK